ncbi:condensation domain-containing protein [Leptolyngbya sp. NIES-2104]|uniref:condensation domain-containing protein n=1 Tax=Leptolyngbya sp. NIES-2104 TaxID=1552121 RepID=UPI0006EC5FB8|nr:condensation domain-containing protein [Leptolyngbya sp. NIES-2104]GAP94275.1 condensation domain [Leptolyngbya sp. NIES-2104]
MERELGAFEHLYWLYNQFHPLDFATVARLEEQLSVDQLRVALRQVQQRHPLLRVRIETDAMGYPRFVETDAEIPIRQVAKAEDQQWQQEVADELSRSLDWQIAPLIRVVLLQSEIESDLILVCHHAIADGLSAVYLIQDIIQGMSGKQFKRSDLSAAASLESALPGSEPYPDKIPKPIDYVPPQAHCSRPHIRPVVLSTNLTQQLIQRSRAEQTTVHGAISAAFLLALAPQVGNPIRCLHPVNVRSHLSLPMSDGVGLYFCFCVTSHSLQAGSEFWEIARSVKSQLSQIDIAQQLTEERQLRQPMISHLTDAAAFMADMQSQYPSHLTVTNLGRVDIAQQYGNIRIAALYAPVAMPGVDEGLTLGVATLGNRLALTLVSNSQMDGSDQTATALLSKGVKHLEQAVE